MVEEKPKRPLLGLLLRLSVTAAIFAYLFTRIDLGSVASSFARLPASAIFAAALTYLVAAFAAVVRWRLLLTAYGATRIPANRELGRWYLVSMFFNLLPGAVGGDVLRGYASRRYFADQSASSALGVVFVERVLGLGGLLILAAIVAVLRPIQGVEVVGYALLGLAIAVLAVASLAVARRMSHLLPKRLARIAASLPALVRPAAFVVAVALAVLTHLGVSLTGHLVIHALDPRVAFSDSLVFFPVGTLAAYFPLTIAGAGTRDAALVALFATRGVARADALVCSLSLLVLGVALSMVGGLLHGLHSDEEAAASGVAPHE